MGTLCRVNGQYREMGALQGEWAVRRGHILVGTCYSVNEQYRKEHITHFGGHSLAHIAKCIESKETKGHITHIGGHTLEGEWTV